MRTVFIGDSHLARLRRELQRFPGDVVNAAEGGASSRDLGETLPGEDYSLRWIYLHMIEEYARHNGHADFLREQIDGLTGE